MFIDNTLKLRQDKAVTFNSVISFSRLRHKGRQSALYLFMCGIFTSENRVISASFYGGQWRGGLAPTGSLCQPANPAICPPPQSFSSDERGLITTKEDNIMTIISKGFLHPILSIITLDSLVLLISGGSQ